MWTSKRRRQGEKREIARRNYTEKLQEELSVTTPDKLLKVADSIRDMALEMMPRYHSKDAKYTPWKNSLGRMLSAIGRHLTDTKIGGIGESKSEMIDKWSKLLNVSSVMHGQATPNASLKPFEERVKEKLEYMDLPWRSKLPVICFQHILSFNRHTKVLFGLVFSCKTLFMQLCLPESSGFSSTTASHVLKPSQVSRGVQFRAIYTRPQMDPLAIKDYLLFTKMHVHSLVFPDLRWCYHRVSKPTHTNQLQQHRRRGSGNARKKNPKKLKNNVLLTRSRIGFSQRTPADRAFAICDYVLSVMLCNLTYLEFGSFVTDCFSNSPPDQYGNNMSEVFFTRLFGNLKASGCDCAQLRLVFACPDKAESVFSFLHRHLSTAEKINLFVRYCGARVKVLGCNFQKMDKMVEKVHGNIVLKKNSLNDAYFMLRFAKHGNPPRLCLMSTGKDAILWFQSSYINNPDPNCLDPWFSVRYY